ncbi:MAG: SPASM domain-containing protein [Ignavibacteriae bacterium]|nr:SPASM domain-containing protein [Ignavibacteriota bacterium]
MEFKKYISTNLRLSNFGREVLFQYKKITGKIPQPDMEFPELISLEIASSCNLSCIHCAPHLKKFKDEVRKFGILEIELFNQLMDEIDLQGKRNIALHKDGEPLLHPKIFEILERVKKNINHTVYITTNAHQLKEKICQSILVNKIDVLNFSIGAATEEFYSKVRGKNFTKVIDNIKLFLELRNNSEWKPKVLVQIIRLPQFEEMENEINEFKKFWTNYDVELQIWNQLTWGVFENKENKLNRYPCYSLWESTFINSDGKASACCMDWQQKLIIGDTNQNKIKDIWQSEAQQNLRKIHIEKRENELSTCPTCNYWSWQPRLAKYSIR